MGHVNFKLILGILGNITAICLFTSPIPTFYGIVKKKTVGDFSGIPYVCTLLNCMLWVVYGLPVVQFQVLVVTINAAGCIIELTYLSLYLLNAPKQTRMKVLKVLMAVLVAFITVVVLVLELIHDKKKRKLIIGTLCAVFAVGMYASPLTVMLLCNPWLFTIFGSTLNSMITPSKSLVIRTRSVEYMPFLLSLFNFINGLVWFGYAFVGGIDIFIAIPNGLGALSGVAQLALYAFYKNATPIEPKHQDGDEKGTPMKPVSHSVYVQMEKNGDIQGSGGKQSGSLPKHNHGSNNGASC